MGRSPCLSPPRRTQKRPLVLYEDKDSGVPSGILGGLILSPVLNAELLFLTGPWREAPLNARGAGRDGVTGPKVIRLETGVFRKAQ